MPVRGTGNNFFFALRSFRFLLHWRLRSAERRSSPVKLLLRKIFFLIFAKFRHEILLAPYALDILSASNRFQSRHYCVPWHRQRRSCEKHARKTTWKLTRIVYQRSSYSSSRTATSSLFSVFGACARRACLPVMEAIPSIFRKGEPSFAANVHLILRSHTIFFIS